MTMFCHLRKAEGRGRGEGEYSRPPAELKGVRGGSSEDESSKGRRAMDRSRETREGKHPTPPITSAGARKAESGTKQGLGKIANGGSQPPFR